MSRLLAALVALTAILAAPAQAFDPARIGTLAEEADFNGVLLISRGDTIIYARAFGTVTPGGDDPHRLDARWRYASVTKQIVATIAMQEVAAGRLSLDAPISTYWPDYPNEEAREITIEQLMRHLSGLADPDLSPAMPTGLPAFYTAEWAGQATAEGYCAGPMLAAPGAAFRYNNCDFIVLGTILERVTGETLADLVAARIDPAMRFYPDGADTVPGFYLTQAEPPIALAAYGAAGGLNGTLLDLWRFDRALLRGNLLDEASRAAMWDGRPELGQVALGQWAYNAPLAECTQAPRLIERHGAIGGIQLRNFLLPDSDMVVIAATNRAEGDFDFGTIWSGSGFTHDLLSEAACHWMDG